MARAIPEQIVKQRRSWWNGFRIWIAIHWVLTFVATVSAALAAAFTEQAKIFGVIAAAASALIGAANPYKRANGFERAHRQLNNACIAFECNDAFSMEALLKANDGGEAVIEESE